MLRRRTMFLAGLGAGVIAGAQLGRERYDQAIAYLKKVTGNPSVRKAAATTASTAGQAVTKAGQLTVHTAQAGAARLRNRHQDDGQDQESPADAASDALPSLAR